MNRHNFLGLPTFGLNTISAGLAFCLVCLGIRLVKASNLALRIANTQLVTSSSADKLELQAQKLQTQAQIIEQKDNAYQQLEATYRAYQKRQVGNVDLEEAFEEVERLPKVENLEEIKTEILETESALLEVKE